MLDESSEWGFLNAENWGHLMTDRPKERGHLPRTRGHRYGFELARRGEFAITRTEPNLSLPGDLAHDLG
jgi:hypothetical protein